MDADLRIQNGIITEIGTDLEEKSDSLPLMDCIRNGHFDAPKRGVEIVFDAAGLAVLPGLIDPQVHFRDPGHPNKETFESGSAAALAGGITCVLDMPNTVPSTTTVERMKTRLLEAESRSFVRHGFFAGASPEHFGELPNMVGGPSKSGTRMRGVIGTKVFMGSSTGDLLVDQIEDLERVFELTDGPVAVHAEDNARLNSRASLFSNRVDIAAHAEWRDVECALLATKAAVEAAESHKSRLHVLHLTSGEEANWLRGRTGDRITTEVLPQHLTFAEEDVEREGTRLKMNPPIRTVKDRDILWERLHDGTIGAIATDHAPHTLAEKSVSRALDAPSGMPGVDTSLAVMMTHRDSGKCSLSDIARWMSKTPADIYQLDRLGRLDIGCAGDLAFVDLGLEHELSDADSWSKVGWTPFRGRSLTGWNRLTVIAGIPAFERLNDDWSKGNLLVKKGSTGCLVEVKGDQV